MVPVYIRVVPQFEPEADFSLGPLSLRQFTSDEAAQLYAKLRRRNVFARHAKDNDFYTSRAADFAEKPVLIATASRPEWNAESFRRQADVAEALIILATAFALKRKDLHKQIAGFALREPTIDLYLDGYRGTLSTQMRRERSQRALVITETLIRRYTRLGFDRAVQALAAEASFSGARVRLVCEWLLSSRLDPSVGSAFIKTGTAAETLIADDSQGQVTRKVSHRIALLTASNESEFRELRDALRALYGVRCDFAHGRHRGAPTPPQMRQLEAFDRLVALGLAGFSHNCGALTSPSAVARWFSNATVPVPMPFSPSFVRGALRFM